MTNPFRKISFKLSRSLTFKLSLSTGLITVLAVGVFAFQLTRTHQQQLTEQVVLDAARFSETVTRSTKWSMLHYHTESIQAIIDTVGDQEGIEKLRIFNKDGLIIYSVDPAEVGMVVDMKAEACYACHAEDQPLVRLPLKARTRHYESRGEKLVGMITPVYNERACWTAPCHAHPEEKKVLGVLDIGLSLAEVDRRVQANLRWTIVFALSVFLVLSTPLGLYLYFYVNRPIKKVVEGAEAMARGERAEPIKVRTGDEITDMAEAFNEMSEKVRLREMALLQAERLAAIGTTVASLAHNIKNILNGLEGGVYVVNAGLEDNNEENIRKGWEMVQRNVAKISDLAYDLLTYAKDRKPVLAHVPLNEIVREVVEDTAGHAEKLQVQVTPDLDPDLGVVWVDRPAIYRALLNLVSNAIDACEDLDPSKHAQVVIRSERLNRHRVRVLVHDNGMGMDQEVQKKIFTTFFSTKGSKGTGLGLLAVQKVVHEHGGQVMVASEVGQGTTFTIFLPDRPPPPS
ncbi:MAG: ATP-binding protein [Thermodesulfobacteriota bacterium]